MGSESRSTALLHLGTRSYSDSPLPGGERSSAARVRGHRSIRIRRNPSPAPPARPLPQGEVNPRPTYPSAEEAAARLLRRFPECPTAVRDAPKSLPSCRKRYAACGVLSVAGAARDRYIEPMIRELANPTRFMSLSGSAAAVGGRAGGAAHGGRSLHGLVHGARRLPAGRDGQDHVYPRAGGLAVPVLLHDHGILGARHAWSGAIRWRTCRRRPPRPSGPPSP